jgi:hypothetical protein
MRGNKNMRKPILIAILCSAAAFCAQSSEKAEKEVPPLPVAHETQEIEGWTVRVDARLLEEKNADVRKQALRVLSNMLFELKVVVNPEKVKRLQQVPIQLDQTHGKLQAMQYHPGAGWLKSNGYSEQLAKCVHIPSVAHFIAPRELHEQPWALLHELAHSYHDQVLGFEDKDVKDAWQKFKDSKKYDKVLHIRGMMTKHYALTNQMEFFSEMTEAYFGANDFYPFNNAELKKEEPELHALLEKIWGPLNK